MIGIKFALRFSLFEIFIHFNFGTFLSSCDFRRLNGNEEEFFNEFPIS